mgnify:CR=1 FL=1
MINKNQLLSSIFHPRESNIQKDEKDILVEVESNTNIGIRLFLKDKKYPCIIFFHGNGELAQEYDDIAEYYNSYKLNFIVCDYRGYGLSDGNPTKDNLHKDSRKIFEYINTYLKDNKYTGKIIIMGRSLGSASACEIIDNYSNNIDGCIIESGFATEFSFLKLMQIEPTDINFKLEDGFMNLEKLKTYKKPLFIIHADLDDIIPFSQAEMILIESPSKIKNIFKVNGANHNNIIMIAREEYFIKIKSFIDSV